MDRIAAIRNSLTGFVCGIIGCIPIIGFLPGLYALVCWSRVRRRYRQEWNPAAGYLKAGAILGCLGVVISALAAFLVGLAIINESHG